MKKILSAFLEYLEEQIWFITFNMGFILFIALFLVTINIKFIYMLLFILIIFLYIIIFLFLVFFKIYKNNQKIIKEVNSLQEKYLISEILPIPKNLENKAYYYALKKACAAMNDKISNIESLHNEYEEFIEIFAHEIKTPISALSLVYDNEKNFELQAEIKKIDNLVEQMLYYARSDNTAKDYFIKELKLDDAIHNVILTYKEYLLKRKVSLNIHDLEFTIYTDEKWFNFILSQIIQNSLKYLDKQHKEIEIYSINNEHNLILYIIDNGCGISESDLPRVFDKCFTGSNRHKEHASGIGLYITKKICLSLGLDIKISSIEGESTTVAITFPKSKISFKN